MQSPTATRLVSALLAVALSGACVDSSLPPDGGGGFPPPPDPPTIDVLPPHWTTVPGKTKTFQAVDPVSSAPLLWLPPAELTAIGLDSHSITLSSGKPVGLFELHVQSSVAPEVVGLATIRVVPFEFIGTLGGLSGDASHEPLADVAVTRGDAEGALQRVFLALYDPAAGSNAVLVFDHAFTTLLETLPDRHFNPVQRPRVAADALGRAFWVEQYFDPASKQRARSLVRLGTGGELDVFDWTQAATGGLELVPGTDLACDDGGALFLMASDGISNVLVRFADPFAPGGSPQVLGPLAAAGSQVQLAVDAQGRLLVAVDALLERWTIPAAGPVEVEELTVLGAAPVDLDADADGTSYALFDTKLDVLDGEGQVVATLDSAEVGLPEPVPFEHLLGLGVDAAGNLRLADDPLADDAQLGMTSLRTFALDVQQP